MHVIYLFVSVSYLEGNEQKIREIDQIGGRQSWDIGNQSSVTLDGTAPNF